MTNSLSPDQKSVLTDMYDWLKYDSLNQPHLTIGGYAGTGKTTLVGVFRQLLTKARPNAKVAFASFTGKASQILRSKLEMQKALGSKDFCGTIHSLIYTPHTDSTGAVIAWNRNEKLAYDLIVIDEASMVTQDIWKDLLAYNVPIIAFGDHGQLPPVQDDFNLMETPDLTLERIHRQAQDSPIIQVATMARTEGEIPFKRFGPGVMKVEKQSYEAQDLMETYLSSFSNSDVLVLCGSNKIRMKLNQHVRSQRGYESDEPQVGETVICLKNNYDTKGYPVYNGMTGKIQSIAPHEEHWYNATISFPDYDKSHVSKISRHQFNQPGLVDSHPGLNPKNIGDRFDFGYALTVHKAQGSQAETVLLYENNDQYWLKDMYSRWLYTAITRASEKLFILG